MALQWTPGGFGTPVFDERQVWVDRGRVSVRNGDQVRSVFPDSLGDAATLVLDGPPDGQFAAGLDVPPPDEPASLGIDQDAASWIGDWYGFVWSLLDPAAARCGTPIRSPERSFWSPSWSVRPTRGRKRWRSFGSGWPPWAHDNRCYSRCLAPSVRPPCRDSATGRGLVAGTTSSASTDMAPTTSSALRMPNWSPRKPSSGGPARNAV